MPTIKPGETIRADCNNCGSEFEVTYEPKAKNPNAVPGVSAAELLHCPLCGSESITTDADDEKYDPR